ncbi:uncharacterized protein LOC126996891 [Eriocheir sinensis]|uniref:uncharacterized protein LOC126996891 n=1 Tax=Eriocheir sinensis TaxID=95602 RepID=UPI0021C8B451|nr:uncharacterized protein LOC126996891 [Eriocheir sinensis]XP_050713766.1 uncharacterized protein LOC126996891 [Eriocheir sinensis]XP_050713767.1 uncharacterized protein LOC126996891 [Eriocheir sinensis]XP_050713768.1 uncharacterized protein LOC126996891 [Eriocheir sinensis]
MLTQLELLGAAGGLGVDEDSSMSGSPLDGLAEYPMEQTEFQYFETSLGSDSYYDGTQHQDLQQSLADAPDLTSPSMCDIPAGDENILIYDQENIPSFTAEDLKFTEDIKPYEDGLQPGVNELKFEDDMQSYETFAEDLYDSGLGDHTGTDDDFGFGNLYETLDPEHHIPSPEEPTTNVWSEASVTSTKGKIGPLQRRALDSIFRVTEKPSRGLVLHIASELGLHHLAVKNFFSNGRRRLRRAAARLNDPERTKRENERRKEKRRLAAQASAANGGGEGKGGPGSSGGSKTSSPRSLPADSPPPREAPIVSPERKALMEKLADKVQRSVAQRSLAADLEYASSRTTQQPAHAPHPTQTQHTVLPHTHPPTQPLLLQSTQNTITQNDILSQASHDLLSQAPPDLLTQSPHDLLVQSPHDFLGPSPASSSLLQPPTDPWDLL